MSQDKVGVGIVGFGYWGPRLMRNFGVTELTRPVAVCEAEPERRQSAQRMHPGVPVVSSLDELLAIPGIDAVAIATPVRTHHALARQTLLAGKHVFVEKPLAETSEQAIELIRLARARDRVLMVDHTFLFTAAVRKLHEIVSSGDLGDLLYYDSIRVNLGLFQQDVDVIWDLAPHDFSILDYVVPGRPKEVSAIGACHSPSGHSDVAYVTLDFDDGFLAHLNLNWLAPAKVRQILIGGSKKMVQYNDALPDEKVRVYDRGIEVGRPPGSTITADDREGRYEAMISYRTGDIYAPWLDRTEALLTECTAFGAAIRFGRPLTVNDGVAGLRVVLMLEAASQSLVRRGAFVPIDWDQLGAL